MGASSGLGLNEFVMQVLITLVRLHTILSSAVVLGMVRAIIRAALVPSSMCGCAGVCGGRNLPHAAAVDGHHGCVHLLADVVLLVA